MILKIASALGKDVSLKLNDKEEPMSHVYSLRIYDTELMRFSMEKQGLSGLVPKSYTPTRSSPICCFGYGAHRRGRHSLAGAAGLFPKTAPLWTRF